MKKHAWINVLSILTVSGIILGLWGFCKQNGSFSDSLYKTFQLFFVNIEVEQLRSWQLHWARWLIFAAFLWATFRLFVEIIASQFFSNLRIKFCYRNHILICGLNRITMILAEKYSSEKIIVLAEESNKYAEALRTKGAKLLIGDLSDQSFLQKAQIGKASRIFAVIDGDDRKNVEIAQTVFFATETISRTKTLKCLTLIGNRKLKTILEDSTLFRDKAKTFDGTLFNINEMGIKYGLAMNIDKILPETMNTPPEVLLVGLTEKMEKALLNLVHCLTLKREPFKFVIVENNAEKIRYFQKRYAYLQCFAEIEYKETICKGHFDAVLICIENQTEAIEKAIEVRYLLGKNEPNIVVFCDDTDSFIDVLEKEGKLNKKGEKEIFTLKDRNILTINLFRQIADYIFDLEQHIEEKAQTAHYFWQEIYHEEGKEWEQLTEHFRQSNRNQILDNYLRFYIARGEKFDSIKNRLISFSDSEKETLAIMEHRRWMIEKYEDGWTYSAKRSDILKQHPCLTDWEKLSEVNQQKDFIAVNLMIKLLNNQ
jgi:hypothetical protein